jgi:hypothetical protein
LRAAVKQWSLTSLREKLVKIGAKVVRHGRYAVLQMAEGAVPKELVQEILRLIDGLRPRPAQRSNWRADALSRRYPPMAPGEPAVCYRTRRSRVYLGNVG